jgi:hypothetical protein
MADGAVKYERKYSAVLFRGTTPSRLSSSTSRFPPFFGAHLGRPSFPAFQAALSPEGYSGRVFSLVGVSRRNLACGLVYDLSAKLVGIAWALA